MCIGLRLNIDDTLDLLAKAGYTLSNSIKRDLVVRYFIENEIYSIMNMQENYQNTNVLIIYEQK